MSPDHAFEVMRDTVHALVRAGVDPHQVRETFFEYLRAACEDRAPWDDERTGPYTPPAELLRSASGVRPSVPEHGADRRALVPEHASLSAPPGRGNARRQAR